MVLSSWSDGVSTGAATGICAKLPLRLLARVDTSSAAARASSSAPSGSSRRTRWNCCDVFLCSNSDSIEIVAFVAFLRIDGLYFCGEHGRETHAAAESRRQNQNKTKQGEKNLGPKRWRPSCSLSPPVVRPSCRRLWSLRRLS